MENEFHKVWLTVYTAALTMIMTQGVLIDAQRQSFMAAKFASEALEKFNLQFEVDSL